MKDLGGRPPKFETEEELQNKINAYFEKCEADNEPLTVSGIALFLGFESRQSLYD